MISTIKSEMKSDEVEHSELNSQLTTLLFQHSIEMTNIKFAAVFLLISSAYLVRETSARERYGLAARYLVRFGGKAVKPFLIPGKKDLINLLF